MHLEGGPDINASCCKSDAHQMQIRERVPCRMAWQGYSSTHLLDWDALGLGLQEDAVQDGQELPDSKEDEDPIPAQIKILSDLVCPPFIPARTAQQHHHEAKSSWPGT